MKEDGFGNGGGGKGGGGGLMGKFELKNQRHKSKLNWGREAEAVSKINNINGTTYISKTNYNMLIK